MTFRTRLVSAFVVVALVPVLIAGVVVRNEMLATIVAQADARAAAGVRSFTAAVDRYGAESEVGLEALAGLLGADNRFRLAVVAGRPEERSWLLDWAREAATLGSLSLLQLHDDQGTILSNALFRNDFGRVDLRLIDFLRPFPRGAGVEVSTPGGPARMLASVDSLQVSGRWFFLVGGRSAEPAALPWGGDEELQLALVTGSAPVPGEVVHEAPFAYLGLADTQEIEARYLVSRNSAPLLELERQLNTWFLGLAGATILAALLAATILARRVSRPVEALAAAAANYQVDGAATGFDTDRPDELGDLARVLDAMVVRLREGTERLLMAERHAVTGDLARQVNHDIKNGLVPIRNVLRHLSEVAACQPAELAGIYRVREATLASSLGYLEELARRYAGLVPSVALGQADLNAVIRQVVEAGTTTGVEVDWRLADGLPLVRADEVALRRIIENLVRNAGDAMQAKGGTLTLISAAPAGPGGRVRVEIRDTGPGMTRGQLDRAFQEFQSGKPEGTGLGLPVVRQLVAALGGTIRVETAPGVGTTCIVEIPAT